VVSHKGEGGRGKGEGSPGKGEGGAEIDKLFQLPLAEFTPARNALATTLKKSGDTEEAERVKALPKPPLSAWAANQLYWRYRQAFNRLLAAGDQFRTAQAAQLAGKSVDLREPLEARREALSALTKHAADVLRQSGHPASPDTMRRILTTLEALATYGGPVDVAPAGRLTSDVDPPGFEVLAALVPRGGASAHQGNIQSRVIPFSQPRAAKAAKEKGSKEKREAAARKALLDAERALKDATRVAEQARTAMKNAAARAKEMDKAKAALETRFEKASADADAARQEARRAAGQAEEAAQALDDAERGVASAHETLKNAERT
jgi:hypothetical protein